MKKVITLLIFMCIVFYLSSIIIIGCLMNQAFSGDINLDGVVDIKDFSIVMSNYGK